MKCKQNNTPIKGEYCWGCQKEYIMQLQDELMKMQYQYRFNNTQQIDTHQQQVIQDLKLTNLRLRKEIDDLHLQIKQLCPDQNFMQTEFKRVQQHFYN